MSRERRRVLGGRPRVELMPPEFAARERTRRLARRLIMTAVLAIIVLGLGYGLAWLNARTAENRLAEANARTMALLNEQAAFTEVIAVDNLSELIRRSQLTATTADVDWAGVIDDIVGVLPADATLDGVTAVGRAPWDPEMQPSGPLRAPLIAALTVTVSAPSVPDAAALVRALDGLPVVADASVDSVTRAGERFAVSLTVNLADEAALARYAPEEPTDEATEGSDG